MSCSLKLNCELTIALIFMKFPNFKLMLIKHFALFTQLLEHFLCTHVALACSLSAIVRQMYFITVEFLTRNSALNEGQICLSVPHTNDRFFFLHIFVPTLELITILPGNFTLKYASHSRQPFCFDVICGRSCDVVNDQVT